MIVTIHITGVEHVRHQLLQLSRLQFRQLADILAGKSREWTISHFDAKAGPFGSWKPWAESTAARRRGGSLMEDTGALKSSVDYDARGLTVWGSFGPHYGIYHHKGTRKMPARVFMGWTGGEIEQVEKICYAYIFQRTSI